MSKCTYYFRLCEKIARIIICSGKQALNQNKFHPPKATNGCPPTTSLKHPNRAALEARRPHQPHAAWQPAGLLCRCRSERDPVRLAFKSAPGRKGVRERGRGQRSTTLDICFIESLGRPHSQLWSHTLYYHLHGQPGLNARLAETCTRNDEMIHTHPQKWETTAQTITLLRGGQRENAYLQGLNGSSMTKRGSGESSCVPAPPLAQYRKLCLFYSPQLKMEAHAVWEPSRSSHWACAMT